MEIFPYMGIADLNFQESLESVKNKLSRFEKIRVSDKEELGKRFPCIYIQDIDLLIVFLEDGNSIRYFEMGSDIYHFGKNLCAESLKTLKEFYREKDKNIETFEGGFNSPLFGVRIGENEDKEGKNLVLVYNKEYPNEPEITEDDIINYYLPKG